MGGYGDFLYQTGMIDELQRRYVTKQTDLGVSLIQQQKWAEAFEVGARRSLFPRRRRRRRSRPAALRQAGSGALDPSSPDCRSLTAC